ncbi:tRNA-dihydrouridine(47) synthase [NAD(P)(+)]-like isoform X3 [Magnolia sinica]|uniref:tRNA-dihydrouridine(47) synthase [NAD(P)(+)]-like isoform X3 n=1 Tax=Magnolia sinica TaxID=86752 RepID=UPI00265886F8|nr:tRNA-dihydrouridine(47) synthase [NAD(P)(+)]-like isoform X3 [Magnolia sinica]
MDGGTSTDGGEPKASAHLKPEELVAKAIAPVKREYLRPPPLRPCSSSLPSDEKDGTASNNDKSSSTAVVVKEKKSKRQLKRERQQEQKSVLNICPEIAKTGNVNACCYDGKCRFSHDLEAFLAQKPADIQGDCPFNSKESCPYGMACRFSGTHKTSIATETSNVQKKISEMNGLNKDVQKLLWKNKMSFPRADAELKRLGLSVKDNAKARKVDVDQEEGSRVIPNGLDAQQKDDNSKMTCDCVNEVEDFADSSTGKDSVDDTSAIDDTRPLKKARNTVDEKSCSSQMDNGITPPERELEAARTEPLDITTDPSCSPEFVSSLKLNAREKKIIDFRGKLYLAPLTTVGNLPFRRVCKFLGADITCGEMAMCTNLLQVRTGYFEGRNRIDSLIADISNWGASAVTIHGRSRQQRYSKLADWDYIYQCAKKAPDVLQVLGNGDIFSYTDWNNHISECPELSTCMIARGALIKPWIFTEIKEQRHWDITSGERLNILKDFVHYGLEHWGSDTKGVETTRHFLLEWLSYTYRYVPVGILDVIPQRLNWRPPCYFGRDDLETLMASDSAADWIRLSEMLLGKVPSGFTFAPKHKSNAYDRAENG